MPDASRTFRSFLLVALTLGASCVSVPGPVGAVALEGSAPLAGATAEAVDAPDATRGPLVLRDGSLRRAETGWAWRVTVANPWPSRFQVSVVVSLLDDENRPLEFVSQDFEIGSHDERLLEGVLQPGSEPGRFRIEYWVRPPPPPERRIERIGP